MKLSVVIPFYNLERYIRECLDSVVAAAKGCDDESLEVICVDDGSTDATGGLLDEYASTFNVQRSTFNLLAIHRPNGGEGAARNAGLAAATGDWITFLDGDDMWHPEMLSVGLAAIARHPDADIVGFRLATFADCSAPFAEVGGSERSFSDETYDLSRKIDGRLVLELGVVPTFFRRSRFDGVRFSALPLGADRLYVAECLAIARKVVFNRAELYGYRIREGSMAHNAWNARKIRSMIDFAAGSLAAFAGSGRDVGREGSDYLMDVLTTVTAKKIARLRENRAEVIRYWFAALDAVDRRFFSVRHRLRSVGYRFRFHQM